MTWNYRVVKRKIQNGQHEFAIYEVYYDETGKVVSMTQNPLTPACSSEEDLLYELNVMMKAFKEDTLDYDN